MFKKIVIPWTGFLFMFISCSQFQSIDTTNSRLNLPSQPPPICVKRDSLLPQAIYGEDNRLEWHQVEGVAKDYWARATVALMGRNRLARENNKWRIDGPEYGKSERLCPGTRFYKQPQVAFCSGFLVGEDLVATAGHCVASFNACLQTVFVFDFANQRPGQEDYLIPNENIYNCEEVVLRSEGSSDFALVRLNRPVVGRTPLNVNRSGSLDTNDELLIIGHPGGLPSKIAGGGITFSVSSNLIVAGIDAFAGNSGSPVINVDKGVVEGLLVSGEPDYIFRGQCREENRCQAIRCVGEKITPISVILRDIPNKIYENPTRLCSPF